MRDELQREVVLAIRTDNDEVLGDVVSGTHGVASTTASSNVTLKDCEHANACVVSSGKIAKQSSFCAARADVATPTVPASRQATARTKMPLPRYMSSSSY